MLRTIRFAIAAASVLATTFPAFSEGDTAAPVACPDTVEQTLYQRIYYLVRGQTNAQQTYAMAQQVEAVCADRPEALGLAALIYSNLFSPDADQLTRHTLLNGIWRVQIAQDKVWNSETNKRILVHDPNNVFATTRLDTRDNLYLIFQKKVIPELMRLHVEGADVPQIKAGPTTRHGGSSMPSTQIAQKSMLRPGPTACVNSAGSARISQPLSRKCWCSIWLRPRAWLPKTESKTRRDSMPKARSTMDFICSMTFQVPSAGSLI